MFNKSNTDDYDISGDRYKIKMVLLASYIWPIFYYIRLWGDIDNHWVR